MTATELRIGNLVYDTKGEVNTVCVETFVKFNHQIKPIPLTEEWLDKLGFELLRGTSDRSFYDLWTKGVVQLKETPTKELLFHGMYIEHVHQLQNLFFALTGQELQPKF